MSNANVSNPKPSSELGFDSLPHQFHGALICERDKPDFKELDLGSPVSPLRTRRGSALTAITTTSNSSSSSGSVSSKNINNSIIKRSDGSNANHSGELSGSSEGSPIAPNSKPGHRRSNSVNSPSGNVLGNICPSGKIGKTGMGYRSSTRSDVLGSGMGNYGHGSIMRGKSSEEGAVMVKKAMGSLDFEEVKRGGNEQYKKGNFVEALCLYDRAIMMSPENAACRSNRAAALIGLGRLVEAVRDCEEAVRLDPKYGRAHQRLASLLLRLGQVDNAWRHLFFGQPQPDAGELQKLQAVEKHLSRCAEARKIGDWKSALREGNAAIAAGAESCPQLLALRAEALLKLHQLEEADSALSSIPKFEPSPPSWLQTKFFGMICDSYPFFVQAQVEMAFGKFENAVAAADKAGQIDPRNIEVATMLLNVRSVARARVRGNDLFNLGKFSEACVAYGEGLKFDPSNPVLFCNRAACWFKLGQWEKSVEDCNEALRIQPNYTKALLRRAASNGKLERWAESMCDYEVLRTELPGDKEVAEALFHAQIALKKSRGEQVCGEQVCNMKFGGEIEEISGVDPFSTAIRSPGVSVVYFMATSNQQCEQISPFVDILSHRYPDVNFLKVNVDKGLAVAEAENVRIVPTFKIYKGGVRVKEMICPSQQVLEYSVRHYNT
ncbi:TPR repeat-containing thioredoxin TTL1-like [Tasmannia lanceolata]|uniref:TPR repeat-containing thioredoxin TTL1-like n=1 Tax=Tasmannia lanceolata TaxID=3420 RepID=UPI0040647891